MKASKIFNQFCKDNEGLKTIARMVINQLGGISADTLRELNEVRSAADGWSGFIYYYQTADFWRRVRRYAVPYMEEEAWGMGYDCALSMVRDFNMFRGKNTYTISDFARCLYGRLKDSEEVVDNALAWYCLETVANQFQNWLYESDFELDDIDD